MSYSLEAHDLSVGDQLISKARQDWGILFPRSVVNNIVLGEWVNTHGIPPDRPNGIHLTDVVILAKDNMIVETYSDSN